MNKKMLMLLAGIVFFGCNDQEPREQLEQLEGYWEIAKVEISEDSIREYKMNEFIDYFEFREKEGFRKKLRPQFDGSYQTTDDAEKIEAKIEDDSLRLYYSTRFDSWKETVIEAGKENLSLQNRNGIIYHYTRFTPLSKKYDNEEEE